MVIVADADSHQPVARASLYSKEGGVFRSTVTDENGAATLHIKSQRITVSHLNYERRITHTPLPDTIFLRPRYQTVSEVVVTNQEPEWIRRKLKKVVKQKEMNYFSREDSLVLHYYTQSIGTNSLYRLTLEGLLRPRSSSQKRYYLKNGEATIEAPDTTRLTDTANLRRMLYEDFMADFDGGFIRSHRFIENFDSQGLEPHQIELRFRSKTRHDDRGWMVVDTARCIVLRAYRFTGTQTNRHERIEALMYATARLLGYRIDTWTRDYSVSYAQRTDGTLYPADVRYKIYYAGHDAVEDKNQREFNEQTGGGFPNMEATLQLRPYEGKTLPTDSLHAWHEMPPSWYVTINTDSDRQREIELANLPATFIIYEDEKDEY